jgi:UDP-galactopyranose mutase
MNTFNRIWNITTPEEAKRKINEQSERYRITSEPRNLEEQAIRMVGTDIYERLIKEYTEKQWGKPCNQLPPSIIKRLPIRFVYDNNYFDDIYQGIPEGGYNRLIDRLLQGIECRTNCDYLQNREYYNRIAKTIVYSGAIDEFYGFCFGRLEYRSLRFENETLPVSNYQGNAIVNYTSANEPYTRIVEHKHFDINNTEVYRSRKTIITREYPMPYFTKKNAEPYYPINDERNDKLYAKYKELARNEKNIIFGGRLAEYKYYDMDDVIESSISSFKHATELAEIKI